MHARESTFAVFDQATGEVTRRRVVGRPHELSPWLRGCSARRGWYEAGPTGYGLARRARAEGIELDVCAPGRTERPPADRVKTDKRDAIRLARLLAAGELTLVTIPSVEREPLRDLVRCREDIWATFGSRERAPIAAAGDDRLCQEHTARSTDDDTTSAASASVHVVTRSR